MPEQTLQKGRPRHCHLWTRGLSEVGNCTWLEEKFEKAKKAKPGERKSAWAGVEKRSYRQEWGGGGETPSQESQNGCH